MTHYLDKLKSKKIVIGGATGAVGREFLKILSEDQIPSQNLTLLASKKSAGKQITYLKKKLTIKEMTKDSFEGQDIAFFSAGSKISKYFKEACISANCILIDNSSAFRMEKDTPLVIPEINPLNAKKHKGVISNPNCSTIIMLMAIFPIYQKYKIKRIIVSTYQAASGAGQEAMEELKNSTRAFLERKGIYS